MAHIQKQKPVDAVFAPFGGIDIRHANDGPRYATEMLNLRLTDDGALERREGFSPVISFEGAFRAHWDGYIWNEYRHLFLTGNTVTAWTPSRHVRYVLATTASSEGAATFFYYLDNLYLCDNTTIYLVLANSIEEISPYVPLIGKDWPTRVRGEIHEQPNLLTRRARISYLVESDLVPALHTGGPLESVDAIYLNGKRMSEEDYFYSPEAQVVGIASLEVGDHVLAYYTYESTIDPVGTAALLSCTESITYGAAQKTRVIFFGGTHKNSLFYSEYVTAKMLDEYAHVYPDTLGLYFPRYHEVKPGDGHSPITAMTTHYDRLLIFTENNAWNATQDSFKVDSADITEINSFYGCYSPHGMTQCRNAPFTVGKQEILCWTPETDESNECNAHVISDPIRDKLSESFFRSAVAVTDRKRNEVWFYGKSDEDPCTWVYHTVHEKWYRFNGFTPEYMFYDQGNVYFYQDGYLFVFDSNSMGDVDTNFQSHAFQSVYKSAETRFETLNEKHLTGLSLSYSFAGKGQCTLTLEKKHKYGTSYLTKTLSGSDAQYHRLSSNRFQSLVLRVNATDFSNFTIYSIVSHVR